MSNKILFKILALVVCLMSSLSAVAAEAYACYTPSNTTLTFYYDNYRSSRTGMTFDLNTGDDGPGWYDEVTSYNNDITRVVFNSSFANARPTTTYMWFFEAANLTTITGLNYLNTSEVTNMSAMFQGCRGLTNLNLSSFNTAKVTDMRSMFNDCSGLTSLNLSGFNTAKVTDMGWMFDSCTGLKSLDLSSFKTNNVTNMGWMFAFCTGLTSLNLSGFQTYNATDMSGMFAFCTGLTSLDVSNFDTYFVEDMHAMFGLCSSLTSLDLSKFNTYQVESMSNMFNGCSSLTTIYASGFWSVATVTRSDNMFLNCPNLVGGMGTTYDANHVDKAYAHIDGGPSNPGYFSIKNEPYVLCTPSNATLTFYYDNYRDFRQSQGTIYDVSTDSNIPQWYFDGTGSSTRRVVFDPSFADFRPTSTDFWFLSMDNLTTFTGMEYLNTSEVTSMTAMFTACTSLTTLDLSHFNTSNVIYMTGMFNSSTNLTTIYVGNSWDTSAASNSIELFTGCTSLVGGKGTTYDANHVDVDYAHIDGGPSNPGYFTEKVNFIRGDVNGDGNVNIADVTELIDILLSGATAPQAANCNLDSSVNIADVTALIDYLLSGHWL